MTNNMINIACCGIINKNGKVLITKRNVSPFKNNFVIPGGKLDEGECLEDCLKREIFEETGLEIVKENFFDYYEVVLPNRYYLVMYFICKIKNFNLNINNEEISEYRWVSKSDFYKFNLAPGTKKILEKYFNDWNN